VRLLRAGLDEYVARRGYEPKVILVEGVGLFAVGETPKMAAAAMAAYLDAVKVMAYATAFGGPRFLNQQQAHFIETWESEHYRRRVAALAPSSSLGGDAPPSAEATGDKSGRVRGKVVAVTGAAQGLGEGIARDVAAQGACVVIADLNLPRAQKLADELNALHGEGRAFAWRTDVTDGESVREMLWQTVRRFGGIDVLISNAGVLKAGSVKTMSDADFGLVTDVNYRGYFHCVKHAAPVMAAQNACNPGSWTDIIQVNSKSGLVGSNRNAAYAGSKFGGIGLTQSFALELVEDGIKVNSVCPGNLFDSPLWSDPQTGLFAQYLRTGKVPGARTVADVRKAYEARVPMRRGCELPDIMAAIYYLIEQKYETGQALPVSGGQVMLR
jgi:NAD(P)-dependent dehydrogenase (short-subunit alcohol dehydrogenase family)